MTQIKPSITRTTRNLPFEQLAPDDFERMYLALLLHEGFENAQHYGAAGADQGRDIVAQRRGELWYIQCKRVKECGPQVLLNEVEKVRTLIDSDPDLCPAGMLFMVSCDVAATARDRVKKRLAELGLDCNVWGRTDLGARVQQHPDIVERFFTVISGDAIFQALAQAPTPISRHIRLREFETLVEERSRHFVGRDFIFKAINDLMTDPDFSSGYIVISGEPGIGKTALLGQMIKQEGYVHHFNIASQNIRHHRDFLGNVCAQLIARYELDQLFLPPEATQDSGFLSQLLSEAAAQEQNWPVIVLVEALDEAEDIGLAPNVDRLYLPPSLPEGVFFVVTSREEHDYRLAVDRREDIYLRDDDPQNLEDVRQYIRYFIQMHRDEMVSRIGEWNVGEDEFVEVITEKSQGNFMYLVHVLRDIRTGKLTAANVDNIRKLPRGFKDYYQRHWRSMKDQDKDHFERYYQPVVCILATVREPVHIEQVAEWTKLDPPRITQVIQTWREFLNEDVDEEGDPLYRIYHTSFQEFLQEEVGLKYYHDMIVVTALQKIPGFLNGRTER